MLTARVLLIAEHYNNTITANVRSQNSTPRIFQRSCACRGTVQLLSNSRLCRLFIIYQRRDGVGGKTPRRTRVSRDICVRAQYACCADTIASNAQHSHSCSSCVYNTIVVQHAEQACARFARGSHNVILLHVYVVCAEPTS